VKKVLFIPSGAKMRASRKASKGMPEATSITRPSRSGLIE